MRENFGFKIEEIVNCFTNNVCTSFSVLYINIGRGFTSFKSFILWIIFRNFICEWIIFSFFFFSCLQCLKATKFNIMVKLLNLIYLYICQKILMTKKMFLNILVCSRKQCRIILTIRTKFSWRSFLEKPLICQKAGQQFLTQCWWKTERKLIPSLL